MCVCVCVCACVCVCPCTYLHIYSGCVHACVHVRTYVCAYDKVHKLITSHPSITTLLLACHTVCAHLMFTEVVGSGDPHVTFTFLQTSSGARRPGEHSTPVHGAFYVPCALLTFSVSPRDKTFRTSIVMDILQPTALHFSGRGQVTHNM